MLRKIAILYLLSMVMLTWGFAIGKYQVFPYSLIKPVYTDLKSFIDGLQQKTTSLSLAQAGPRIFFLHTYPARGMQLSSN